MCFVLVLVLLDFGGSLSIKCVLMNSQPGLFRATVVDLNLDETHYYSFIISRNRCDWIRNIIKDSLSLTYIPKNIEDMNLNYLNLNF